MAITRQNTFEGGSSGSAVTTGNSGGTSGDAWDAVTVTSPATANYDSTAGRGSVALQIGTGASATAYVEWQNTSLNAGVSSYLTLLIRRSTLPTVSLYPIRGLSTGGATAFRFRINTSGNPVLEDSAGTVWTGTSVIPTGSYFRVEIRLKPNSTPANGEIECRYFNTATGSVATESSGTVTANLGVDVDKLRFGNTSANNNGTTYFDDIAFGTGGFLGALGGSTDATATPSRIVTTAAVGDPVETTGWTVTPAKVTTASTVPTPGVSTVSGGGTSATVVATTVATASGVMSVATVRSNTYLDAAAVLTAATVNTPGSVGTASFTVATPAKITTVTTVPAVTVSTGGSATVTPASVATAASLGDPTIVTGVPTTVTAATIGTVTALPAARAASSSVAFAATVITTTTTVGAVTVTTTANLFLFRTPIRQPQGPRYTVNASPRQKALYRHVHHHDGYPVAVLMAADGTITEKAVPSVDDINGAARAYLGGRDNVVSGTEAAILAAAGYDLLTIG